MAEYEGILDGIAERGLRVNVALKLTHLGLLLDEELAYENVRRLVDHAASRDNFIRIDMEHSGLVDQTLGIYRRLRAEGRDSVGTVLQAYLFRTPGDLSALEPLRPNLRLVKGAYLEPAEIAYPRKADVDAAYAQLIASALEGATSYTAIATHDEQTDRADDRARRAHGRRARPLRVPDALRRAPAAAARSSRSAASRCSSRRRSARSGTRI